MKKQDCRVGMVVRDRLEEIKAVVVKCNPKNARVRTLEEMRGYKAGVLWNIPYALLDPVVADNLKTEMAMRSFEQSGNEGIKAYFVHSRADEPVDFPDGSPEHHLMSAVCELWRRLDREEDRRRNSEMINRIFAFLGREVSRSAAERWETGKIKGEAV